MKSPVTPVSVEKFSAGNFVQTPDLLVTEEPLELRLRYNDGNEFRERRLAVTMRTPGNDFELALGFLLTEGIIRSRKAIEKMFYCEEVRSEEEAGNVIVIVLDKNVIPANETFNRNFYITSSCGVCGKSSIESIRTSCQTDFRADRPVVPAALVHAIPDTVRRSQQVFAHTGGLHASALLSSSGELLLIREDVGRHNALDKLIGARAAEDGDNASSVLFVSGRVSFELVQKAYMAGIPVMIAVGAPSSLAIDLARDFGMTVIGFARNGKFNVYAGFQRLSGEVGG